MYHIFQRICIYVHAKRTNNDVCIFHYIAYCILRIYFIYEFVYLRKVGKRVICLTIFKFRFNYRGVQHEH